MELGRLLRRGLLVAAVAAAGWLLSAVFASSASAEGLPGGQPQTQEQPSGGLVGGLLGGVTKTVTGLTDGVVDLTGSVVDTSGKLLPAPVDQPAPEPIIDVPELLPVAEPPSGTERADTTSTPTPTPPPAPKPVAPAPRPVAPAPVQAAPVAPKPAPAPVVAPRAAVAEEKTPAGDQAGTGSDPEPVKKPAGPSTPGTSASAGHDHSGGARGMHGVLVSHATLAHPADAGFTSRSLAVNAAGRDTGLPAASPD